LEQAVQSCGGDEARLLHSDHGATFIPLLREIDTLTNRMASQIESEPDSVSPPSE
jgi:hypothetical protein